MFLGSILLLHIQPSYAKKTTAVPYLFSLVDVVNGNLSNSSTEFQHISKNHSTLNNKKNEMFAFWVSMILNGRECHHKEKREQIEKEKNEK